MSTFPAAVSGGMPASSSISNSSISNASISNAHADVSLVEHTYVVGIQKDKISVLEEDEAIRESSDEIPEVDRFDPRITQNFIFPEVKSLAGFSSLFASEGNMLDFLNRKITSHCTLRVYNILKATKKGSTKELTYEPTGTPYDLRSYVAEPMREVLSPTKKLERLVKQYFANDPKGLQSALAEIARGGGV